jgi:hypothetical protein
MILAVNGMVIEQHQVLFAFVSMIFLFALQCIGMYWIMMDEISAIAATIITFGGMYIWYHYCLRIYNRFYWDQSHGEYWKGFYEDGGHEDLDELSSNGQDDPAAAIAKQLAEHNAKKADASPLLTTLLTPDDDASKAERQVKKGSFSTVSTLSASAPSSTEPPSGRKEDVTGYLSLKVKKRFPVNGNQWQRRYFLLRGRLLFHYTDRQAFTQAPGRPINLRPVDLRDYEVQLVRGGQGPPFEIKLVPLRGEVGGDAQSEISDSDVGEWSVLESRSFDNLP